MNTWKAHDLVPHMPTSNDFMANLLVSLSMRLYSRPSVC